MRTVIVFSALLLAGCCGGGELPLWVAAEDQVLPEDEAVSIDLADWVEGGRGELIFTAHSRSTELLAWTEGSELTLQAQPDSYGTHDVVLDVSDRCDRSDRATITVSYGSGGIRIAPRPDDRHFFEDPCAVSFVYEEQGDPDAVYLVTHLDDWEVGAHPMEALGQGTWMLSVPRDELPDGGLAYKFVEESGGSQHWTCDPSASMIHCEEGYIPQGTFAYDHDCSLDVGSCNSFVLLEDPDIPRLWVDRFEVDGEAGSLHVDIDFQAGCAGDGWDGIRGVLDGEELPVAAVGQRWSYYVDGLADGRHTLRVTAFDHGGRASEVAYLPFWIEPSDGWRSGVLYFAFVDRFARGSVADSSDGATADIADWEGGDLGGVIDSLDYLEDLGVTAIWLSNLQDNAAGTFEGDCGSYSAYHGYWPTAATDIEEHFGDDALLRELVAEAHARGIRVIMDWAANHVHEDHPYFTDHPSWFEAYSDDLLCDALDNWNDIPETCWFDPFLPDIQYYEPEPLAVMIEDGLWWAREYDLDGFRVDAAKHMPHAVVWNMSARIEQELEHRYAGGDQDFYTVGETFAGADVVAQYVNDQELDAQFDFDLYWTLRAVLLGDGWFADLEGSVASSQSVYGDALMGTFLGNHDVSRFVSYGETGGASDGLFCEQAILPGSEGDDSFARLRLGWTFLLTHPGLPLIYYGDELGLPGNHDPDNRHPLWWYAPAFDGQGPVDLDDVIAGGFADERQREVLEHVAILAAARQDHPALSEGDQVQWWIEEDVWAYARTADDDAILVVLNGSGEERSLSNGLAFAGLPGDAVYRDLLTGSNFEAAGDSITVSVPPLGSRVLVLAD
jgi:neopullulanase